MKKELLKAWMPTLLVAFFLAGMSAAAQTTVLVPRGADWKYHNLNQDLGTAWQARAYDDTLWFGPLPGPLGNNDEGGIQRCASVIDIGPAGTRFPVLYYRRSFTVASAASYSGLILRLQRDDTAVVYLNGSVLYNDGVPEPVSFAYSGGTAAAGNDETNYFEYSVSSSALVDGFNVLAVENHQQAASSSDLQFDLQLEGLIDNIAPTLIATEPQPGSIVIDLTFINVVFSETVTGVNASDLLINNVPATSVTTNNSTDYTFAFSTPATGTVQVAWAANHGITDTSPTANPFVAVSWTYTLNPNATAADVVMTEFLADNSHGAPDDDGNRSDWIELANFGALSANLNGWFLTDETNRLTKWRLPAVFLDANKYIRIWASGNDRTNPAAQLHTNFRLAKEGGFLALVDPNTNIVSSFNPYPAQQTDVSYGRDRVDRNLLGYFSTPTPGAQNSTSGSGFAPEPVMSLETGIYTNSSLTLTMSAPSGTIRYTVNGTLPNATNSLVYTTPIIFGTNVTIKARVFPASSNVFPSQVAARTFLFLDDTTKDFNSNLPLLIISTEGRVIPENVPPGQPRAKGSLVLIDSVNGRSSLGATPEFHGLAEFEIFGQTSSSIWGANAKKPIRVEIQDELGNDLKVSLLGAPAESDYRLRNPYGDKTLMNDFLAAEIHEQMGHYSLRPRYIEAFVDSGGGRLNYATDYYGVLVLFDTIERGKGRVDIAELTPYATNEPAISGGWIIKYDKESTGDLNIRTPGGGGFSGLGVSDTRLKIHDPKPSQLRVSPLSGPLTPAGTIQVRWLTNWLAQMERTLYATDWLTRTGTNHYSYYLDPDSFADFHWLVEFTKQIDGYRLSNYMQKDRNGRLKMEPAWDWNLSFGCADYLAGGYTNGWYYEDTGQVDHPWLRRLITGSVSSIDSNGDPEFTQKIADRWGVLRTNVLNGPRLLSRIDELTLYLTNAAVRDFARFPRLGQSPPNGLWPCPAGTANHDGTGVPQRPGTTGAGPWNVWDVDYTGAPSWSGGSISILNYMKKWVLGRYLWIDGRFTPPPILSSSDAFVTNGFTVTITGPPGATIYYRTDGVDPRGPGGTTNGTVYAGPITVNGNIRVVARAKGATSWKNTWSGPVAATLFTGTPPLRITEIMFHPADPPPGSTNSAEDFQYVEVKNVGGTDLIVNRFTLSGDVEFLFPAIVLGAGQSAVIVKNMAAFQARYGDESLILGVFTGDLNNAGGHLVLRGGVGEPILDFSYQDKWYPAADGLGFSLVAVNENAPTSSWGLANNWRASSALGGSPGQNDPAPPFRPAVVVNEALTHTDPPFSDAIELYNPTASPADISGWFLSDDFSTPKKYLIPNPTIILPFGYVVFYETNSFNFPSNLPTSFSLSSRGDEVWLFSGDGVNLTGHAHGFDFGPSANGVSFGRYVISTGADHFVVQRANSLNATNAGPLVGPMIVSEINWHPVDVGVTGIPYNNTLDEFIELKNIATTNVLLYDPAASTNTWHLRDAVDFEFPSGVTVPPSGYVLVVSFDPGADPAATASFRARNSVPGGVPLYGPWNGNLDNEQDSVELVRPDVPETNGVVSYLLVDKVNYSDRSPWPNGADGFGTTLQRLVSSSYGNDPSNWVALVSTPGSQTTPSGNPPAITSQPAGRVVPTSTDVMLSVTATGTLPLRYQWQRNGLNLAGATNFLLSLNNFQASQAGVYNVGVYNSAGSTHGTNFTIATRTGLKILVQPTNRMAQAGQTTNFNVVVEGTGPIFYQWRLNGAPITATNVTGANSDTLTISNIQSFNEGAYTVSVSDDYDAAVAQPATLSLIARPLFTVHPLSQTALEGSSVTFSVAVAGSAPITFRWRRGSTNLPSALVYSNAILGYSSITLTNLQMSDAAINYNVVVSNILGFATGGPQNGVSSNATLTVLADTDRDGIPDSLEPLDGAADNDGDGVSNAAEYFAGTDYNDASSFLRVSIARTGVATLSLIAVANRTYTIQYTDGLNPIQWQRLADVVARNVTRTEMVFDPNSGPNRFYRLATPIQR